MKECEMKKILLSLLVATAGSTFAADTTPKNTADTASKNTNAPASDLETAAKGSDTTPAAKTVDNNSILPTINKDTVQGSWEQLKGSVKEMYGKTSVCLWYDKGRSNEKSQ
jgi:hypothetical protein